MEEVLILVVQFVVEVLIQSLIYAPFDLPVGRGGKAGERGYGWYVLYLVLGGVVGGLSLLVAPNAVIRSAALRVVNLVVAPVAAGGLAWGLTEWRRSRGAAVCPRTHLWTAFWFVLAFGGVRLAYAGH